MAFEALLDRLTKASGRDHDLYEQVEWPEVLPSMQWCMSPELMSLFGTPMYEVLDEAARYDLSRLELIQFFSLNVHGERRLIAGLDERSASCAPGSVTTFLAHFRDEEIKHHDCFEAFCRRYGNGVYRDRNLEFPATWTPAESEFVFFARVLIFEAFVDHYNRIIAADRRVVAVVRQINRAHHHEEARHLAFGRAWLGRLARHWGEGQALPDDVAGYLRGYRNALWRELFNPDVYRDAGMGDPLGVRDVALACPQVIARRERAFADVDRFFAGIGIPLWDVVAC